MADVVPREKLTELRVRTVDTLPDALIGFVCVSTLTETGTVEHPSAEAKESANFRDPRGGPGQSRTADTRIFSRRKKP